VAALIWIDPRLSESWAGWWRKEMPAKCADGRQQNPLPDSTQTDRHASRGIKPPPDIGDCMYLKAWRAVKLLPMAGLQPGPQPARRQI